MRLLHLLEGWAHDALGVDISASPEQVRKAWLRRVIATHPDKGGNEEEFKQVQSAYEELTGTASRPQQHYAQPRSASDFEREWEKEWARRQEETRREEEERKRAFDQLIADTNKILEGSCFSIKQSDWGGYEIFPSLIFLQRIGVTPDSEVRWTDDTGKITINWEGNIQVRIGKNDREGRIFKPDELTAEKLAELIEDDSHVIDALRVNFGKLPWGLRHIITFAVLAQKSGFDVKAVHGFLADREDSWGTLGQHPFAGSSPRTWIVVNGEQIDYNGGFFYPATDDRYRAESVADVDSDALDRMFYKKLREKD